jgi:hypothetical protein
MRERAPDAAAKRPTLGDRLDRCAPAAADDGLDGGVDTRSIFVREDDTERVLGIVSRSTAGKAFASRSATRVGRSVSGVYPAQSRRVTA